MLGKFVRKRKVEVIRIQVVITYGGSRCINPLILNLDVTLGEGRHKAPKALPSGIDGR
jgi:hypothetical protein